MTCLEGWSLGLSACATSIRGATGVAVAEISFGDPGVETMEWDCWAYEDTHKTIATRTSNGLKDRKNRRTLRFIVINKRRRVLILSGPRSFFREGLFLIARTRGASRRIRLVTGTVTILELDFVLYAVFGSTNLAT